MFLNAEKKAAARKGLAPGGNISITSEFRKEVEEMQEIAQKLGLKTKTIKLTEKTQEKPSI